jgi:hypothetical protein
MHRRVNTTLELFERPAHLHLSDIEARLNQVSQRTIGIAPDTVEQATPVGETPAL